MDIVKKRAREWTNALWVKVGWNIDSGMEVWEVDGGVTEQMGDLGLISRAQRLAFAFQQIKISIITGISHAYHCPLTGQKPSSWLPFHLSSILVTPW